MLEWNSLSCIVYRCVQGRCARRAGRCQQLRIQGQGEGRLNVFMFLARSPAAALEQPQRSPCLYNWDRTLFTLYLTELANS